MNLIDDEQSLFPLKVYSENPTRTLFKKVYSDRFTHHNRWLETIDFGASKDIYLCNLADKNIHIYKNMCLILTYNNCPSLKSAFQHITHIVVKFNDYEVLNMSGNIIYEILRTDSSLDKINRVFIQTSQLIIPIHKIIIDDTYVPNYVNTNIKFQILNDRCLSKTVLGLECVYLSSSEYDRFMHVPVELMSKRYHYEDHKIDDKSNIYIPVLLPIKTIILMTDNNANIKANIEFRRFNNSVYNYFCDNIDLESNSYYLNTIVDKATEFVPTGAYIPNNKNNHINVITDKSTNITILYCCRDYLKLSETSIQFGGVLKIRQHNGNYYPLTKISDSKFIEGYWFPTNPSDKDFDIGYPKPICQTKTVDINFINKFKLLNKKAESKSYFGSSNCRICNRVNGSNEFISKNDSIEFTYPEGLFHYYEDHNVHPSDEFYNFVMDYPI